MWRNSFIACVMASCRPALSHSGNAESKPVPASLLRSEMPGTFSPCRSRPQSLGVEARKCTLQSLINHWTRQSYRRQASVYAALSAPTLLVLQVARFNDRGNKVKGNVTPPWTLDLPVFIGPTSDISTTKYRVACIIYHIGGTIQSGHCRTAVLQNGSTTHASDDNRTPVPLTFNQRAQVLSNSYLFFLHRIE